MSLIDIQHADLFFKMWREKRIKNLIIPGSKKFNAVNGDGTIKAINDLTLKLEDGDRLGIIGHNGAGKSSLLKMIAGIYPPTTGKVIVQGRISSMFELATGFEMEASGWENIYLRGLMLGETPQSIKRKTREIAEFTELGDFLNMPVKYYSSGMFIRLAFAVSTAIEPEILLLDEVLAAGDAEFLNKANARLQSMIKISNIMVLVTHSMDSAVKMCNKCIWMERGKVMWYGKPQDVVDKYMLSIK